MGKANAAMQREKEGHITPKWDLWRKTNVDARLRR
jgi:hypothetical protein